MTSRVIIPFNNNPINSFSLPSLTTTTYTVPTGRYSKVQCTLQHALLLVNNVEVGYNLSYADKFSVSDGGSQSTSLLLMGTSTRNGIYSVSMSSTHLNNARYCQLRHYRDGILIWTSANVADEASGISGGYRFIKKDDQLYRYMSGNNGGGTFTCSFSSIDHPTNSEYDFWLKEGDVVTLKNPVTNTDVPTTGTNLDTIGTMFIQEYQKVT